MPAAEVASALIAAVHIGEARVRRWSATGGERLLNLGADLDWVPEYAHGTPLDAARRRGTQRSNLIEWLEHRGARSTGP